jgi:hypothetical protein
MNKMAPIISDKFYVSEKFKEEDSMNSMASDASRSNVSMSSIGTAGNSANGFNRNAMSTGGSHMSVDQLNMQMTVMHIDS